MLRMECLGGTEISWFSRKWEGGRSTIDVERLNSQLSLLCEKAIASVDPGGRGRWMINAERMNSQLSLLHEKVTTSVDPGGADQQST